MQADQLPITAALVRRAITALQRSVEHRPAPLPRDPRTLAALDYLARALPNAWGVGQFREGLTMTNDTSRSQNCRAALAAIERQVGQVDAAG